MLYCEVRGCWNSKDRKQLHQDPKDGATKARFFQIPKNTILRLKLACEVNEKDVAVVCSLHFKSNKLPEISKKKPPTVLEKTPSRPNIKVEPGESTSTPTPQPCSVL